MAKLFRLACRLDAYGGPVRPPKPDWLREENREHATRSQAHSFTYWTKIYWATPPWITPKMADEMRRLYTKAPAGHHVDHIVPLSSPVVCGLHVPWNLQHLPDRVNLSKSNHYWPGHPCENAELFPDLAAEPYQLRLAI